MLRLRRVGGGVRPLGVVRPRSALWLCSCVRLVGAAGDSGGALDVALGTVLGPLRGLSASGARENWLLFVGRCTIEKLLAGCKTLVIKRVWVFPKPWAGAPPTSPSTITQTTNAYDASPGCRRMPALSSRNRPRKHTTRNIRSPQLARCPRTPARTTGTARRRRRSRRRRRKTPRPRGRGRPAPGRAAPQ